MTHTIDAPSPDGFHRHIHNEYEVLYFCQGDAEFIIEGIVYQLKPGDLLLIHPRQFHYLRVLTDSLYERFVFHFQEDQLSESLCAFVRHAPNIYSIPEGHLINRLYTDLAMAEKILPPEDLVAFSQSIIQNVLLSLKSLRGITPVEPIHQNNTLQQILQYINARPKAKITAEMLATEFFVSPSWLVHTFRKTLGISLMQYVCKNRILYAQSCIRSGVSPGEMAQACHFDNYATFYRQYKKIVGHSPQKDVERSNKKTQKTL